MNAANTAGPLERDRNFSIDGQAAVTRAECRRIYNGGLCLPRGTPDPAGAVERMCAVRRVVAAQFAANVLPIIRDVGAAVSPA